MNGKTPTPAWATAVVAVLLGALFGLLQMQVGDARRKSEELARTLNECDRRVVAMDPVLTRVERKLDELTRQVDTRCEEVKRDLRREIATLRAENSEAHKEIKRSLEQLAERR